MCEEGVNPGVCVCLHMGIHLFHVLLDSSMRTDLQWSKKNLTKLLELYCPA